jgi:hypothetical protein
LVTVRMPPLASPPPLVLAKLSETVLFVRVIVPNWL